MGIHGDSGTQSSYVPKTVGRIVANHSFPLALIQHLQLNSVAYGPRAIVGCPPRPGPLLSRRRTPSPAIQGRSSDGLRSLSWYAWKYPRIFAYSNTQMHMGQSRIRQGGLSRPKISLQRAAHPGLFQKSAHFSPNPIASQFSIFRSGTRSNSLVLFVTSTASRKRA